MLALIKGGFGMPAAINTYCKHGHELTPENTFPLPNGKTECRACRRAATLRWRARIAAGAKLKREPREFCKRELHLMTPENTYFCLSNGVTCRECKRAAERKSRAIARREGRYMRCSGILTTDETDSLMQALKSGRSLASITGTQGHTKKDRILSLERLKSFRKINPDINDTIVGMILLNRPRSIKKPCRSDQIIRSTAIPSKYITCTNSWMDEHAIPAIQKAVAQNVPFFIRDDIRQELMTMVWAGEIALDAIPAMAKKLLRSQYSSYDLASKWGHRSLDAVLFDDGTTTLGDTITRDLWD
ncbi:hypothetical protein [Bradyrhizobium sp. SYSU BS000235]|uniref:hypothetical protein n=1 Tax=Bradyrhizobium sp. SYSU BS000235 TaxID=3411332 RepID=UPI003C76CA38